MRETLFPKRETTDVTIKLPVETLQELGDIAVEEGVTINQVINRIIELYLTGE